MPTTQGLHHEDRTHYLPRGTKAQYIPKSYIITGFFCKTYLSVKHKQVILSQLICFSALATPVTKEQCCHMSPISPLLTSPEQEKKVVFKSVSLLYRMLNRKQQMCYNHCCPFISFVSERKQQSSVKNSYLLDTKGSIYFSLII